MGRLSQDSQQVCTPICPLTITMDKFKQYKKNNDMLYSPTFYTHHKGYKMCVHVCANGYGECKGTHVTVSVQLMKGEFDDQLKWPFRGQIIVQLLSQVDMEYTEFKYTFIKSVPDYDTISCRQLTSNIGRGSKLHTDLQPKMIVSN